MWPSLYTDTDENWGYVGHGSLSGRVRQIHLGVQRRGALENGDGPVVRGKQVRVANMGEDEKTTRESEGQKPVYV
jgi:hypothetical protein